MRLVALVCLVGCSRSGLPSDFDRWDTGELAPADEADADTDADSDTDTDADTDTDTDTDTGTTPGPTLPPGLAGVNLLENPGGETGDLTGWTVTQNGGDGWAAVQSGPFSGVYEFATSWSTAVRSQSLDLLALGFTEAQLDAQPVVEVSEMIREICQTGDPYAVSVQLLDETGFVLDSWGESGVSSTSGLGCDYTDDLWWSVSHSFTGYGPGLRTIVFEDGGQDSEFWAGHYGVRFDDAEVSLN